MANTTIQLNNGTLDINKEIGVALQYSVAEVQNPEKRTSNYSKSILLPGTKKNNRLLGNLFDVNEDFTFFNPNFKTEACINVDSTTVMNGYLQLVSIEKLNNNDLSGNNIQYNVTVFSEEVDFFKSIGDKLLSDLDFSEYNHTLTRDNIVATWNNGRTAKDIYAYPILYKDSDLYLTEDFKPAIYHKAYVKKIIEDAGFNASGSFLDNDTYIKEIIPFAGGQAAISQTEINRRLFRAGMSSSTDNLFTSELLGGTANNNGAIFNSGLNLFTSFDDDSVSPNFDNDNSYNTTTHKYTVDRNGSFNLKGTFLLDVNFNSFRNIGAIVSSSGGSTIDITSTGHNLQNGATIEIMGTTSYNGVYNITYIDANTFRVNTSYVANESGTYGWDAYGYKYKVGSSGDISVGGTNYKYTVRLSINVNGVQLGAYFGGASYSSPSVLNSSKSYTENTQFKIDVDRSGVNLVVGDEVTINYEVLGVDVSGHYIKYNNSFGFSSDIVPLDMTIDIEKNRTTFTSFFKNESNGGVLTDGDTVNLNSFINPKIKQKDLIIDIIKRYNVYIYKGQSNSKQIVLETRDDYYNSGTLLNWTNKKDFSSTDKIQLISELQNKEIEFKYDKGEDGGFNKSYSESIGGDSYGQKNIVFDNEFIKGVKEVKTPIASAPLVYNSPNKVMVVPGIGVYSDYEKIRVLYYDGAIDTLGGKFWRFEWVDNGVKTTTQYTTYPYAGHFDDPINPTIDINFGKLPYTYYSELEQYTDNNLYSKYWTNYVNQISEGKIVTSKFYLNEVDISFISENLNSKIFVRDSYYYINKIKDYNPVETKLTTVELIKIVDGVSFVPRVDSDYNNPLTPLEAEARAPIYPIDLNGRSDDSFTDSSDTLITNSFNRIGSNSDGSTITGSNNEIGNYSPNTAIIGGSNNLIGSNVSNSFIIGSNNKTITQSNEIYIGDVHIVDGVIHTDYNLIDSGIDEVYPLLPSSSINLIDSGTNTIIGDYNNVNFQKTIDGGTDKV